MALKPWEIDRRRGVTSSRTSSNTTGANAAQSRNNMANASSTRPGGVPRSTFPTQERNTGKGTRQSVTGSGSDALAAYLAAVEAGRSNPPGPTPPGPGPSGGGGRGRGYGGGGGGGGGGMSVQGGFDSYAARVMDALGRLGGKPAWAGKIGDYFAKDQAHINSTYDGIPAYDQNAYEGLTFEAPTLDPELAALVTAQGGSLDEYGAATAAAQNGLDRMRAEWQNFGTARAADVSQEQARMAADVDQQRAAALQSLGQQRSQMELAAEMELERQKQQRIEAIIALLGQGFQAGADVSKVSF